MSKIQKYYTQKTVPWASVLGDAFIVMIPILITAIQGAPNLAAAQKHWYMTWCSIILTGLKFVLKTIKVKEENVTPNEESID